MAGTSSILNEMRRRLAEVKTRSLSDKTIEGLFIVATVSISLTTTLVIAEAAFQFGGDVRTVLFLALTVSFVSLLAWFGVRPLLRLAGVIPGMDDLDLAGKVGSFFPHIRDRLLNLLQLHQEILSGKSLYSVELVDASFDDLATLTQNTDFKESLDRLSLRRWRTRCLWTVGFCAACLAVFPTSFADSLNRLIRFDREFVPPAEYVFEVVPGNKEVVKGENVDVSVKVAATGAARKSPSELSLISRSEGQTSFDKVLLHADTAGVFHTVLKNVRGSLLYFAQVGDVQSEWYELKALDRPLVRSFQIRLDYPPYTNLPPRVQDEFVGDVTALAGTRITLKGASNKDLQEAVLAFGNGQEKRLSTAGVKFSTTMQLTKETSYHLQLKDLEGLENLDPVKYQLKVLPDEFPSVSILEPGRNIDIAGTQSLPLTIQAKDDFGFTRLRIGYRLVHSRYERPSEEFKFVPIPFPSHTALQLETRFVWDLSRLDLVPEDVLEYFAEVFDNDIVKGPKSSRSTSYLIRLPSMEEVFADVDKVHETSLEEMKQTMSDAQKLKEALESINQDLKKNKEFDWQKQKKLEEMAKKYQEVQKKLEDVKNRLDQTVQKMNEQGVLSRETMEKYLELQQLFDQLDSAELQKALKQMQQAMQNINKEQLRQALQQMTFSEERFRQSIERTISLLKRIQIEQKFDEVKKRSEELAKEEKSLKEQTPSADQDPRRREELAKKQEDLARKEASMEQAAKDLQEKMQEFFAEMPADKLMQLNKRMMQQKLSEQMAKAAQQMRQGQPRQAQQMQQEIQKQLDQFSQELDALQQEMLQQNAQFVMNEMRRAVNNLLELSKRQEELKQQSQNAPSNSPQLRQNAQDQMRVMEDLGNVIQGLSDVSQRSFAITPEMGMSIGEALNRMRNAMRNLDVRSGGSASQEQTEAMGALNRAATQLQKALQAMMQGGQGSGMGSLLSQMQSLAGQQMSINQQTISMQQAAEAARLAQEQDAVRKSLEQLNKEAQTSGDQKKLLGDLERIAEDMKEVVRNLEQNKINPETIQKQERILSRLLDASKSMRERDFEKKRKAETGTQVAGKSPNELDPNTLEGRNRLREDLLKALEQGYSKDYKELIRKYFEQLQKTEKIDQ